MRIAVIHSFYDRKSPSGENSVVKDQVAQLRAVGHEVELIARYSDELSSSRLYPVKAALGAATQRGADPSIQLARFQPDVIHCHNLFPNWGSQWLYTWASRTVATVHNYRSVCAAATLHRQGQGCQLCPQHGAWNAVKHQCYRGSSVATAPLALASRNAGKHQRLINKARHLIFLNDEAATTMTGILGPREHSVIANFVEQPSHGTLDSSTEQIWLYAGRLTQEKGILTLMEHWPRHRRLKIVGDGPLKAEVRWVAEREPETFTYCAIMPRDEMLREISASYALVVPSLWKEGLPTVVLEALAAQKPVLISEFCSATADLVSMGGVVAFNPNGIDDITTVTQMVEDDHDGISRQSLATYAKHYSPTAWTTQMEPIYERTSGAARI